MPGYSLNILNVRDVAEFQLCSGCGACEYMSPGNIRMVDVADHGLRPVLQGDGLDIGSREALAVCPGARLSHTFDERDPGLIGQLRAAWGPVFGVWEGHAADPDIRLAASSGGAAAAISLHCLERHGMHGVLHSAVNPGAPWLNETVMSRTRQDLLARTGSRYAPASPCSRLDLIEAAPAPCVFIGKPCDIAAAQRARVFRAQLDKNIGLTIGVFCAGTPSTRGTLDLMKKVGIEDCAKVLSLRYRGNGWPGRWVVRWVDATGKERETSQTYDESWAFLQKYRQWRCYVCPDHTGEFADIAVGDPWYRPLQEGHPGSSLIVARSRRGFEIIHAAMETGHLVLTRHDWSLLPKSQPNLLQSRGRLWGQMAALKVCGVPFPKLSGFPTWRFWLHVLSLGTKIRSIVGTLRRVVRRQLRHRIKL